MASSVEAAWYFDGSGVPVGWNEGAVAFNVVPSVFAWPFVLFVATGAILEESGIPWPFYGCSHRSMQIGRGRCGVQLVAIWECVTIFSLE